MRGYGSPSNGVANRVFGHETATPYDWGYGDPSGGTVNPPYLDWGYGDRMPNRFFAVLGGKGREVPDSGGIILDLRAGVWPANGAVPMQTRSGPFVIRLKNAATDEIYPKVEFGCHAGREGAEWRCETDLRHEVLSFVLPVLPPAEYHIEIRYGGVGFPNLITVPHALVVIHRGRATNTYTARTALPTRFASGARHPRFEILLGE